MTPYRSFLNLVVLTWLLSTCALPATPNEEQVLCEKLLDPDVARLLAESPELDSAEAVIMGSINLTHVRLSKRPVTLASIVRPYAGKLDKLGIVPIIAPTNWLISKEVALPLALDVCPFKLSLTAWVLPMAILFPVTATMATGALSPSFSPSTGNSLTLPRMALLLWLTPLPPSPWV